MRLHTRTIGIGFAMSAIGIMIGSLSPSTMQWMTIIFVLGIGMLFLGVRTGDKRYLLCTIVACVVLLGIIRGIWVEPVRSKEMDAFVDVKVELVGVVARDLDRRSASVQYVLQVERIEDRSDSGSSLVLATLPRYPEYRVGDELVLSGTLMHPTDFEVDALRQPFPYVKYLAKEGIGYVMRFPEVTEARPTERYRMMRMLSGWKAAILEKGNSIFPEPEGGLLAGMILGERHALPSDILDEMRIAGLVHIIVVSGYNMTVVAEGVSRIFRVLPLFVRAGIGLFVIWIYAGMVAGGAPVVRAAIMTSLALVARMTGNSAIALRLLYLSAIVMIVHNPRIVLDDASFHLSFLATLGLITLSPRIVKGISGNKDAKHQSWWKELFATTVAAQAMVIPYILFFSGQLSPYALPANLLALPLVPIAMALGASALLLGVLIPWAGPVLGMIASIPAWWVISVGHFFASLPGSGVILPIPLWATLVLYLLGWFAIRFWWKSDRIDVPKE